MNDDLSRFEELAREISTTYEQSAIFGDWIPRTVGQERPSIDYYQAGQIAADMPDDFFVPATATTLADDLVKSEKHHIIQQVLSAEDDGIVKGKTLSDYSLSGFVDCLSEIRNPSLLILPTKKGRPKRINDQLNTTTTVPYGARNVDVEFVSQSTYGLERGVCLSDRVEVSMVEAESMGIPDNFSPVDGGDFSEDDGVIQLMAGESVSPTGRDFIYRTVFSQLERLSSDTACLMELPD
ncbi:hypothetical protein [Haloferax volcanii]|uniref:hypothetical protein n=1 Tax=Haloferax volcanii TaxID=2246 RepID=UPI0038520C16